jgi:hypothetical protein
MMMELMLNGFKFLMIDGKKSEIRKTILYLHGGSCICVVKNLIVILQALLPKKQMQEY